MKVVILAGGFGTRLAEVTEAVPKPMIEIGGRPLLWHIMRHYASYGHDEFFVALGYRGEVVKRYFLDYHTVNGDLTVGLADGRVRVEKKEPDDWVVHLIDTGLTTNTGGRVRRLASRLAGETFMLTYGDGVSDVDLDDLLGYHRSHGLLATVTAVRPPSRFGGLTFDGGRVARFDEKPQIGEGWINGGFFVFEPAVFDLLEGDATSLENDLLARLAAAGQLAGYRHKGFWQCMDTLRDRRLLEQLWDEGDPPWKTWG
jgi:glucose-1-phosphate cytidylyltransferase